MPAVSDCIEVNPVMRGKPVIRGTRGQTYLLLHSAVKAVRTASEVSTLAPPTTEPRTTAAVGPDGTEGIVTAIAPPVDQAAGTRRIRLHGSIPPEVWNRVGNRLLPKLRTETSLDVSVAFEIEVNDAIADHLVSEIRQILVDLSLIERIRID